MKKVLLFLCLLLVSCGKNEKLNVYSFILDKKLVKIERKGEIRIKVLAFAYPRSQKLLKVFQKGRD